MIYYYSKSHHGVKRLFIQFPYNSEIISALREMAPCRWSKSEKAWHFEPSNAVFEKLKASYPEMQPLTHTAEEDRTLENTKTEKPKRTKLIVRIVQ